MKINIKKINKSSNLFYKLYFVITIIGFILSFFIFTNLSVWENYKKDFTKRIYLNGISNYQYLPKIFALILKNSFYNLESFNLEINQKNIIILENNRSLKIANSSKEYITAQASIENNGKKIKTKIRLKGDRKIHYENKDKSSYKFNINKKNVYKSLTSFSIQKPRIRNYVHEWIFHKMAKEIDLISLEYNFIKFNINGENKGLFIIEEGFSNTMLEKNKRRAGPIFGLNEDFEMSNFSEAKFDPYQLKYWLKPENQDLYLIAKDKLSSFQNRKFELNKVIDLKKWSDYFVLCDLLFTHHGLLPKSVKFYYNPITGLFEPIPFDGHKIPAYDYSSHIKGIFNQDTSLDIANKTNFSNEGDKHFSKWLKLFFFKKNGELNIDFYLSYQNSLKNLTDKKFLNNFLNKNKKKIDQINAKIYLDDFQFDYDTERKKGLGIYYFDKDKITDRANILIKKNKVNLKKIVIDDYLDKVKITNRNFHNNKLKIKKLLCNKNSSNQIFLKEVNYQISLKKDFIEKKKLNLSNIKCTKVILIDVINNDDYLLNIEQNLFSEKKKRKNNLEDYFILNGKVLELKYNETVFDKNIFIPKNFKIIIKPNQTIRLIDNAFIFSESNWYIVGNQDQPILISGYKDNLGGGIFISSKNKNILKNVKLKYLKGIDINSPDNIINNLNEYRIYGALNFYKTKVEISDLYTSSVYSEDSLNIIKSEFDIRDSFFTNISSDAIDFDFSNGLIENLSFDNISDDALDFSGSKVTVKNIFANGVDDKIVSAGENSVLNIDNLKAHNSFIGVANKDGSKLILTNSSFDNVKVPLAGYIKKKIYKKSYMKVTNSIFSNFTSKYVSSKDSTIYLNNEKLINNKKNKDILEIVYK